MRNEEATCLTNDLENNLEMSLIKLEASNSFLEVGYISKIEENQSSVGVSQQNDMPIEMNLQS